MPIDQDKKYYNRQYFRHNKSRLKAYRQTTKERRNANRRKRYQEDSEYRGKCFESSKKQRLKNPLKRRSYQYKIDAHKLELLMNNGCMVCGASPLIDPKTKLHVDHDHQTGKIRGILCNSCNLAIGHLHNDPIIAASVLRYLMRGIIYE